MQRAKPTLLIVDDDGKVLEILSALLRHFGFAVIATCDPIEALQLLKENTAFAGVISDFQMPGMNGEELAQSAKALRPDLPVYILSGVCAPPEQKSVPWDGWFTKGASIASLISTLDTVKSRHAAFCSEPMQQRRNAS